MRQKTNSIKWILGTLLLILTAFSFWTAANAMLLHSAAFPDDFIMRYRESKYVLWRMNPFEVVLGHREPLPEIGPMWDVAGYTPWGMVLGILLNFTFFPEPMARMAYLCFYLAFFAFTLGYMYVQARRYGTREDQWLVVCIAASFPAWGTALGWLNFGALMGVLIFWSVMLSDEHELAAGILLGLAATKPQLALPFYLAYLLRRKYKIFLTACVVPTVLWGICACLTATSPIQLILQLSEVTGKLAGDLGGWLLRFGIHMDGHIYRLLCAAGGIGLAFLFWYRLWKRGNRDNLFFFSVPAVMCGVWTYSQDHDQTVLLILLFCLYGILKNDGIWWSGKKLCISIFLFALIINPEIFALLQSRLVPLGPDLTLVYKLARYVLLILSLYVITGLKLEEM